MKQAYTKTLLVVVILLALWSQAQAQSVASLVEEGNKAYNSSQFDLALEKYSAAQKEIGGSPQLDYNIGNTLFRLGRLGEALANFRRAQIDTPRNIDLQHNLALTIGKLNLATPAGADSDWRFALGIPSVYLSRYEFQIIALSSYIIFWVIVSWNRFKGRKRAWGLPGFFFLVGGVAALFGWGSTQLPGGRSIPSLIANGNGLVVVKEQNTKVYSGDSETFQVVAVLNGGSEVRTGELRPDWTEIYLSDGRRGWIKRSDVAFVEEDVL